METNDKPNPTNPSEGAGTPPEEISAEEAIRRGVKAVIDEQKAGDTPAAPQPQSTTEQPKAPQGGSGSDVTPGKDSSSGTDPNTEVLSLIEGSTGRKFENIDDAKKYLANLNSLVGDQSVAKAREDAKLFQSFVDRWATAQGQTADEAKRYWADQLVGKATAKPEPKSEVKETKAPEEIKALQDKVDFLDGARQQAELFEKHPYARKVKEEVAIIAKQKGVSQLEAFEQSPFKSLLEKEAQEESQRNPTVTPSNRVGFDQKKVQELGSRVMSPRSTEEDKIALVREVLGIQ